MREAGGTDASCSGGQEKPEYFQGLRWLSDHWRRPFSQPAYYWYLTFEDADALRALAEECQRHIDFPYYDLTPLDSLHLTLDRIALEGDVSADQLGTIESAAIEACRVMPPLEIDIGCLGGTRSAIGFSVFPVESLQELRDTLRKATLSAYPNAAVRRSEFNAHVTIAYANSDGIRADEIISAVEKVNATRPHASVIIGNGTLILLERHPRAYAWKAVSRIPMTG